MCLAPACSSRVTELELLSRLSSSAGVAGAGDGAQKRMHFSEEFMESVSSSSGSLVLHGSRRLVVDDGVVVAEMVGGDIVTGTELPFST